MSRVIYITVLYYITMSKTVNIDEVLYNSLQHIAEIEHTTLKKEIEDILENHMQKKKLLNDVWNGIELEKVVPNGVVLKNLNERKFYDVEIQEQNLYCKQDKSKGCMHTSFVWMQLQDLGIPISK